jgi:phage/plasmid-associated DNA primase
VQKLYSSYHAWAKNSGYIPVGKKNFNTVLRETCKIKVENKKADQNQLHVYNIERIDEPNVLDS